MKKEEPAHNYKDCSLDFQDDYVHIVQKGQFETDVFYHNINALTYEYAKQTVTIEETGLEIKISTQNEKNYKPLGTFFVVLSVFLLGFAAIVLCLLNDIQDVIDVIVAGAFDILLAAPVVLTALGCAVLGILFFVIGLIILIKKQRKLSFKAGYDELNKRYHEKQQENIKIRKRQIGVPPSEQPLRMKSLNAPVPQGQAPAPTRTPVPQPAPVKKEDHQEPKK